MILSISLTYKKSYRKPSEKQIANCFYKNGREKVLTKEKKHIIILDNKT